MPSLWIMRRDTPYKESNRKKKTDNDTGETGDGGSGKPEGGWNDGADRETGPRTCQTRERVRALAVHCFAMKERGEGELSDGWRGLSFSHSSSPPF